MINYILAGRNREEAEAKAKAKSEDGELSVEPAEVPASAIQLLDEAAPAQGPLAAAPSARLPVAPTPPALAVEPVEPMSESVPVSDREPAVPTQPVLVDDQAEAKVSDKQGR
jgi:hypothetical protein